MRVSVFRPGLWWWCLVPSAVGATVVLLVRAVPSGVARSGSGKPRFWIAYVLYCFIYKKDRV